jgi:hypothetical protein
VTVFRRRRQGDADSAAEASEAVPEQALDEATSTEPDEAPKSARPEGPWDVSELDTTDDPTAAGRVDLGGLLVPRPEGGALQVQVEERTGRATSVMLVLPDAAVQVLAVAAPRSSGLWPQTRLQIVADAARRGGSATEAQGPLGTEVRVVVPVARPDGTQARQPSRVVGIDGPRWLLRATFLGKAVNDPAVFDRLASLVRAVVVVRGDQPMAPGDLIPLTVPPGAAPQGDRAATRPPEPPQPPTRR